MASGSLVYLVAAFVLSVGVAAQAGTTLQRISLGKSHTCSTVETYEGDIELKCWGGAGRATSSKIHTGQLGTGTDDPAGGRSGTMGGKSRGAQISVGGCWPGHQRWQQQPP